MYSRHCRRAHRRSPRDAAHAKAAASTTKHRRASEEMTALTALDKLLKKYDRRSTPTNDLGKNWMTP